MKTSILTHAMCVLLLSITILSCDKKVEPVNTDQTFIIKYDDNGTQNALAGATVELYADVGGNNANGKYNGDPPLLSGTTNENGEIVFTKEQFESVSGKTYPLGFNVFIKKDLYSNIQHPDTYTLTGDYFPGQTLDFVVRISMLEAWLTPVKWHYKRSLFNTEDVTSFVDPCSLDNYIESYISTGGEMNLYMHLMDGTDLCDNFLNIAFYTPIILMYETPVIENGNILPTMSLDFRSPAPTITGNTVRFEVKNDSLYYSTFLNGNTYQAVYFPEY